MKMTLAPKSLLLRRLQFVLVLVAVVFLAIPLPAFSQSCYLCYTQAASGTTKLIQALRSGILVLMLPPLFLSAGITYLAYRKRNQFKSSDNLHESNNGW
jgi:hypothetical protein